MCDESRALCRLVTMARAQSKTKTKALLSYRKREICSNSMNIEPLIYLSRLFIQYMCIYFNACLLLRSTCSFSRNSNYHRSNCSHVYENNLRHLQPFYWFRQHSIFVFIILLHIVAAVSSSSSSSSSPVLLLLLLLLTSLSLVVVVVNCWFNHIVR